MNAEGLLDARDLLHHVHESVLAEQGVLALLERFAELAVGRGAHELGEGRKQHRVLSDRVRPVHADEGPEGLRERQVFGKAHTAAGVSELQKQLLPDVVSNIRKVAERQARLLYCIL